MPTYFCLVELERHLRPRQKPPVRPPCADTRRLRRSVMPSIDCRVTAASCGSASGSEKSYSRRISCSAAAPRRRRSATGGSGSGARPAAMHPAARAAAAAARVGVRRQRQRATGAANSGVEPDLVRVPRQPAGRSRFVQSSAPPASSRPAGAGRSPGPRGSGRPRCRGRPSPQRAAAASRTRTAVPASRPPPCRNE